jgi:hypothetical protein
MKKNQVHVFYKKIEDLSSHNSQIASLTNNFDRIISGYSVNVSELNK